MNTTAETKSTRRSPSALETIATIEAAVIPAPTGEAIRSLSTTEQNAKIRALLKSLGIKGVSVKRSGAHWQATVAVSFPSLPEPINFGSHDRATCPSCAREIAAIRKLEAIILAAFPDCDNRSDYQSDYFDYVFGVSAE